MNGSKTENSPMNKTTQNQEVIRLALPKKGRLYKDIVAMLEGSGLKYVRQSRLDIAWCKDLPVQLVFLPAKDIATFVGEGDIDIGITGLDIIGESEMSSKLDILLHLGIGKCKLALLAPVKDNYSSSRDLIGKRICTSFPNLSESFFSKLSSVEETSVRFVSGSVEASCSLGLADAVVDLVETGTTMKAAGLEIIDEVMSTETVLIKNKGKRSQEAEAVIGTLKKRFEGYLAAKLYKMVYYNIPEEKLNEAKIITPGRKAPSVTKVDLQNGENWIAVGVMVKKAEVAGVMDRLSEIGATDIFVLKLDNCRLD
eukprot:snap_masked-scaffold_22-processed-gene-5.37-mRNA-1 protein AED:0.02 eAED:0.02 QI:0/-1/0/1/-1/1/1/0/311